MKENMLKVIMVIVITSFMFSSFCFGLYVANGNKKIENNKSVYSETLKELDVSESDAKDIATFIRDFARLIKLFNKISENKGGER